MSLPHSPRPSRDHPDLRPACTYVPELKPGSDLQPTGLPAGQHPVLADDTTSQEGTSR